MTTVIPPQDVQLYGSFQCLSIGLKNQSHRYRFMGWNQAFTNSIEERTITIGIIGLGYVGLPTAIGFYDAGFTVWGVDISERTVAFINEQKIQLETLKSKD